jgi:hypothetical protein
MNEPEIVLVPRELFYHEKNYVRGLEDIARLVLLFHRGGPWAAEDSQAWQKITGNLDVTTKSLCDFVRKVTNG